MKLKHKSAIIKIEIYVKAKAIEHDGYNTKDATFRASSYEYSTILDYNDSNDVRAWVNQCEEDAKQHKLKEIANIKSYHYSDAETTDVFVDYKMFQPL